MTNVPSGLENYINLLDTLVLSNNKITTVDVDIIKNIKKVYLKNNNITDIFNAHLLATSDMEIFDITNNPLNESILSNAMRIDISRTGATICMISSRTHNLIATNKIREIIVVLENSNKSAELKILKDDA